MDDQKIPDVMEVSSAAGRVIAQTDLNLTNDTDVSSKTCVHSTMTKCDASCMENINATPMRNVKQTFRDCKQSCAGSALQSRTYCEPVENASVRSKNLNASSSGVKSPPTACSSGVRNPPSASSSGVRSPPSVDMTRNDKIIASTKVKNITGSSKVSHILPLPEDHPIVLKAHSLAQFVVDKVTNEKMLKPKDKIEETLFRCVTHLMIKHEIVFHSMMKRLDINKDTGYLTFVQVANELFEHQKMIVTWSRIIALYAFAAELAKYCKEKNCVEYAKNISMFTGKYLSDFAGLFIMEHGGWDTLVQEFPSGTEASDNAWKLLTWTAVGLGLATATMFFKSH